MNEDTIDPAKELTQTETADNTSPSPHEPIPVEKKKPSRLCRWIVRILIALVAFCLLVFVIIAFFVGEIAAFAVNKFGSEILGVDRCQVESMKIYPLCGSVTVKNFEIGKPIAEGAGFSSDLLSLEFFDIDVDVTSLLSQKKIIDHLVLKNLKVAYEAPISGSSNIDVLLNNLSQKLGQGNGPAENVPVPDGQGNMLTEFMKQFDLSGEGTSSESSCNATASDENAEPMYIGARLIDVSGISAKVSVGLIPVPVPEISFKFEEGLGMDEDLTQTQFGVRIAERVMNILKGVNLGVVGDAANAVGGAVGGAAGTATNAVEGAAGAVIDGLGSIFDGNKKEDKKEE